MAEYDELILPDWRMVKRFRKLLARAWKNPSSSFPQMMEDAAQLEGGYRFFNNERVQPGALLAPHAKQTRKRAEQYTFKSLNQQVTYVFAG